MKIVSTINSTLTQLKPVFVMMAYLMAVVAVWLQLAEWVPVLRQIWVPRGASAQGAAIMAACLAIVAGRGN